MIRARNLPFLLAFLVLGASACGDDDDPTGPTTIELLAGSWTTQSFTYTAIGNPQLATPNLADLDAGVTALNINANGSFTGSASLPGFGVVPLSGNIEVISSTIMEVGFTGAAAQAFEDFQASFDLDGDNLSFESDDVTFDYSALNPQLPAGDTPSILAVTMIRID